MNRFLEIHAANFWTSTRAVIVMTPLSQLAESGLWVFRGISYCRCSTFSSSGSSQVSRFEGRLIRQEGLNLSFRIQASRTTCCRETAAIGALHTVSLRPIFRNESNFTEKTQRGANSQATDIARALKTLSLVVALMDVRCRVSALSLE